MQLQSVYGSVFCVHNMTYTKECAITEYVGVVQRGVYTTWHILIKECDDKTQYAENGKANEEKYHLN